MTRQAYLEQKYEVNLAQKIRGDKAMWNDDLHFSASSCVALIMSYDPTHNKRFSQWLIETFLRDGFLLEDLGKARETLELFATNQRKLALDQRDIGRFRTLGDLWLVVKRFHQAEIEDDSISGKALRRLEKQHAYEQSIVLLDEPDATIAIPTTEEAAKWWGRGTRWCTSADNENAFYHYHRRAPLIVIDLKRKGKFQIFTYGKDSYESFNFMNSDDIPASEEEKIHNWHVFGPILRFAVENHGKALCLYPREKCKDLELSFLAIMNDGSALEFVDNEIIDYEICTLAVSKNGMALMHVPLEFRDGKLCKLAVTQDAWSLRHVPYPLIDYDLCCLSVESDGQSLWIVPERFRDRNLCALAVDKSGSALEFVPEKLRDYDLCLKAVSKEGKALKYVPKRLIEINILRTAVMQNGHALWDVPEELVNQEICYLAVNQTGLILHRVPDGLMTYELCRVAVSQTGYALKFVPEHLRDDELIQLAVCKNEFNLNSIPISFRNEDLCRRAVALDGSAIAHVPRELRDFEICCTAVRRNHYALEFVPEELVHLMPDTEPPAIEWIKDQTFTEKLRSLFGPEQSFRDR